jgi:hypothetical protein
LLLLTARHGNVLAAGIFNAPSQTITQLKVGTDTLSSLKCHAVSPDGKFALAVDGNQVHLFRIPAHTDDGFSVLPRTLCTVFFSVMFFLPYLEHTIIRVEFKQ